MLVYGINHHATPIAIREKLVFQETDLPRALHDLTAQSMIHEAVILSTCNRTEIYTNDTDPEALEQWLSAHKYLPNNAFRTHCYTHHEENAVRHMMRVASGLDSMVLGEPQVLGQIKKAYAIAEVSGTVGSEFKQIFPAVFSSSKAIRANTDIGMHPVSLAYTITKLFQSVFQSLTGKHALLIGAGEIIALMATHLRAMGVEKITIANRTPEKSEAIATAVNGDSVLMHNISSLLERCDIVITATTSQLPILGKGMIENSVRHRQSPLLLIDLAVPRDIESEVSALEHVHLYNIDDLQTIIANNLADRTLAVQEAEGIIECHFAQLQKKMRIFQTREVITQYRERLDTLRTAEMEKALVKLQRGADPRAVLETFGHQLINKIMHHPTMKLREAASENKCVALQHIKEFFETE